MSGLFLLSDELVKKIAAFDISDNLDLYDPRFGNAGNNDVLCPTCNMRSDVCMGHHALLSLGTHMFHPLLYKESQICLNNTCIKCGTHIVQQSKSKTKKCESCNTYNLGDYVIQASDLTQAIGQKNPRNIVLAESVQSILPDGLVISKILVPPIHLRIPEDMEWSTDLQSLYNILVAAVNSGNGKKACETYASIIKKSTKKGATKKEAIKKDGVIDMMSQKNGVFRSLMAGKRLERSARAVVVGDPNLKLDQVGVPKAIAESIKINLRCTKHNINYLKDAASNKLLWWQDTDDLVNPANILEGMIFQRTLMDGDLTMLNRQPSLSRVSLMCFKVVIHKDDKQVISINPQVTQPFNADFDGDEMNLFFMSNRAEMMELCHNINTFPPVQDLVTGCYMMSCSDEPVSDAVWHDCAMYASCSDIREYSRTTFGLLKMCIPNYDGRRLNKKSLKAIRYDTYALQLVVDRWLSLHGLTVPLKSIAVRPITKATTETVDEFRERCVTKVRNDMSGTSIMNIINSGAKGSIVHASHMAVAIGQQYISGKEGVFCNQSYAAGLTPDEFFGHQMAAREGVVRTGVSTAGTGYLNRRACKTIANLKLQYNGTVADNEFISSFYL